MSYSCNFGDADDRHWTAARSVFSLGLALAVAAGGSGELEELSEGGFLVVVADESLLVDDLGSVVDVTANVLHRGGWVALGTGLSLADAVLGGVLQSHGESSLEILAGLVLSNSDSDGVVGLGGVELAIDAEGRVGPVLAVPLGRGAVESLGNSPDNVL